MADLEFTGGLDLTEALSALDDLATNATASLADVSTTFAASLAAEAGAALADIAGASAEVPITADIAPAQAEVATLVSSTDAETATISVEADTAGADAAVSDLGSSIDQAGGSADASGKKVEGFGESAALVAGSAALARGEVGGLGEAAVGAGLGSAAAVGGVAALGASVFELAQKGIEATSAEQRFNTILGDTAEKIEKVKVGTLTADLGKLGIQFGSTDTDMKNAAAGLFQFALNSGASHDAAAQFTDQVVALSARAISLNPQLGNLGDVAESLGVKIARGGRFAASYGIALTAAEINTRALSDTQKTSASDLTIYEKATAATELAVEKYGGSLGTVVAEGAKNAANEQKSFKAQLDQSLETLGKPLVAPLFAAIKAALPDVVAIAKPLAEIGLALLPAIASAASLAAPPLQLIADAIHEVPGPALAAGAAVVILSGAIHVLAGSEIEGAESAGLMASAHAALTAEVTLSSLSMSTAIPVVGAFFAGYAIGTEIFHAIVPEAKSYEDRLKELDAATAAVKGTNKEMVTSFGTVIEKYAAAHTNVQGLAVTTGAFQTVAQKDLNTAAQLAEQYGKNTTVYKAFQVVLRQQVTHQNDVAASAAGQGDALQRVTGIVDTTSKAYEHGVTVFGDWAAAGLTAAGVTSTQLDALATQSENFAKSLEGGISSFTDAFSHAFDTPFGVVAQQQFEDFFVGSKQQAADWAVELKDLINRGVDQGIIQEIAQAGPKSKPELDAFVQTVDEHGVDWVNSVQHSGDAATAETEKAFNAQITLAAEKGAEQQALTEAYQDAITGHGTQKLEDLTHSTDKNLALMAYLALLRFGDIQRAADALHSPPPIDVTIKTEYIGSLPPGYNPFGGAAEGAYVPATPGGQHWTVGEGGTDEVIVSPRDLPSARTNLARLGVLDQLLAAPVYTPSFAPSSAPAAAASGTTGGSSISVGQVVLQQASTNPVREAIKAGIALRDGASLVKL